MSFVYITCRHCAVDGPLLLAAVHSAGGCRAGCWVRIVISGPSGLWMPHPPSAPSTFSNAVQILDVSAGATVA